MSNSVEEISFFAADPWMGLLGQVGGVIARGKGESAQQEFGLVDPGRDLSEKVRHDLLNAYRLTEGNDFQLKISSRVWAVNTCVMDNCRTSRQFWYWGNAQLSRTSDGAVIANKNCLYRGFVEPDTYWNDNAIAIKEQGRSAVESCRKEIIDWISGDI